MLVWLVLLKVKIRNGLKKEFEFYFLEVIYEVNNGPINVVIIAKIIIEVTKAESNKPIDDAE